MWMLLVVGTFLGLGLGSESPSPGVQTLQSLHCPSCERIHCAPRRALKLQCKGGVTTGICGCCPACARTVGESCGGTWDYLGKCDKGLVCVYQESTDGKPDAEQKGICKAGNNIFFKVAVETRRVPLYFKIIYYDNESSASMLNPSGMILNFSSLICKLCIIALTGSLIYEL